MARYWIENAGEYDWDKPNVYRNFVELPESIKRIIELEFLLNKGRHYDISDTADRFLIVFTAFIYRWNKDMPVYIPPRRASETIEYPAR